MTTLIAVFNSEGCVGRCDAKCYDATQMECDCACGGRNHGQGLRQAQENTAEMAGMERQTYRELRARAEAMGGERVVIEQGLLFS